MSLAFLAVDKFTIFDTQVSIGMLIILLFMQTSLDCFSHDGYSYFECFLKEQRLIKFRYS